MQIHESPFQPQLTKYALAIVEAASCNPVQFQDQEFLPEKEVEEQRHDRGFSEFYPTLRRSVQELLGHNDVSTRMIYSHVLNQGGEGVWTAAYEL
jgi:hypothetical protein